jgi:putative DNA primase/helicase
VSDNEEALDLIDAAEEKLKRSGDKKDTEITPEIPYHTDLTNAEAIAKLFGDKLRFDHKRKRWLIWQGHSWKPDIDGSINRFAADSVRQMYKEAGELADFKSRNDLAKWAISSEGKQKIDNATSLAKSILPLADDGSNWDKDQMLLSCPNGIIELASGKLRDGKPEDRITMCTNTEFDPEEKCPRWEQFIEEIFEGNAELIHYIQKALGYSLTGETTEQCAFFCHGKGSNGKSTFFSTLRILLGDYAHSAPASTFQRNPMNTNSNDVAATENKRFLLSAETLSATKLNEQLLKGWTGGDEQSARYLYSEYFSFLPTCKPWLFLNHMPIIEDDSDAFWRRVRLVPFNRSFKGKNADPDLTKKLNTEHKGILAWLVRGCSMWQEEKLEPTPEIVLAATSDYQSENDVLYEFICDQCEVADDSGVKVSQIYRAYTQWAEDQGQKGKDILSLSAFGRRMTDKYQKVKTKTGYYYRGIFLKNDEKGEHFPIVTKNFSHEKNEVNTSDKNIVTFIRTSSQEEFTKNTPKVFTEPQKQDESVHQVGLSSKSDNLVSKSVDGASRAKEANSLKEPGGEAIEPSKKADATDKAKKEEETDGEPLLSSKPSEDSKADSKQSEEEFDPEEYLDNL